MSKPFKTAIETLVTALILFTTYYSVRYVYELINHKFQSKSFIVYHISNVKTDKSKIRLYFNGTAFQSVLAEDYAKEELEKEFAMERINVNLAKEMYRIMANTIEIKTMHGDNTTVKAILLKDKNGDQYMPLFRTKEDYDAFFKEIF